jgi:AcrR family transcriptional regulator
MEKKEIQITNRNQLLLLDASKKLFWKYGLKKVSVQEICQEAGISKMTFYRFYKDKTEIAKAVFEREVDAGMKKFRAIMKEKSSSAEKIKKIVQQKREGVNDISKEFLADFYNNPELGLKAYIEEKTRSAWHDMLLDFKEAQKKGWFRKDMKPEFLFYLSQKVGEMLNDPRLAQMYDSPQELVNEITNFFAYGISPHE